MQEMSRERYEIVQLDFDAVAAIYQRYLAEHFAKNEIKPLASIERMWKLGFYHALAILPADMPGTGCTGGKERPENVAERLIGYAFFTGCPDGKMLLLDYLAIRKEFRGMGFGQIFLQELQNADCAGILIETEDLLYAETEEERIERCRRNSFYRTNGVQAMELHTTIYSAHYEIWQLPVKETLPKEECRAELKKIYRFIVPNVPEGDQRVQI